jgi:predicted homoserine dehydrogenase-like protein
MIIVDGALKKLEMESSQIKVAMVGAGFMAKAVAHQICKFTPGILLVAISNRNIEKARLAYEEAGVVDVIEVDSTAELERNIRLKIPSITSSPMLLTSATGIDAIIEVTGTLDFSAKVTMNALKNRKHVILMNAALDATLGPILKVYAERSGVILTNADGNPCCTTLSLYRQVKSLGIEPIYCGNTGYRQSSYERQSEARPNGFGQNVKVVSSFADGTKGCFEQAILANATGMHLCDTSDLTESSHSGGRAKPRFSLLGSDEADSFPADANKLIDADSKNGVFILATTDDAVQQHHLSAFKIGEGSMFMFKMPFQMSHFEVPTTVAKAVLYGDAAITPLNKPYVEVVATAKKDIKAGGILDGIGGSLTYGTSENADDCQQNNHLPLGIAENCIVKHNVAKGQILTYDDVILPHGRLIDKLREEQNSYFNICNASRKKPVHR